MTDALLTVHDLEVVHRKVKEYIYRKYFNRRPPFPSEDPYDSYDSFSRSRDNQTYYVDSRSHISLRTRNIISKPPSESLVFETDSGLSFSSESLSNIGTISIVSLHNSIITPTSSHYLLYPVSRSASLSTDKADSYLNENACSIVGTYTSESNEITDIAPSTRKKGKNDVVIMRVAKMNQFRGGKVSKLGKEPIRIINDGNMDRDSILKIVDEIMLTKDIGRDSSMLLVVPSDEYETEASDARSSTICVRMSENFFKWNAKINHENLTSRKPSSIRGLKLSSKGKRYFMGYPSTEVESSSHAYDKGAQVLREEAGQCHGFSMDTTQDRPCCCAPPECQSPGKLSDQCVANVVSDLITPMMTSQGFDKTAYQNISDLNMECRQSPSCIFPNQATSTSGFNALHCKTSISARADQVPMKYPARGFQHNAATADEMTDPPCLCNPAEPLLPPPLKPAITLTPARALKSTGCNPPSVEFCEPPCRSPGITSIIRMNPVENPCSTCGKSAMKENKCTKEKRVTLQDVCPCDEPSAAPPCPVKTKNTGCQCCICKEKPKPAPCAPRSPPCAPKPPPCAPKSPPCAPKSPPCAPRSPPCGQKSPPCGPKSPPCAPVPLVVSPPPPVPRKPCECDKKVPVKKKRGWRKANKCICPQVEPGMTGMTELIQLSPPPEYLDTEDEDLVILDEKQIKKMQSDLSQVTSGFKFNMKRRPPPPPEPEPEPEPEVMVDDGSCTCDDPPPPPPPPPATNDVSINCRCPPFGPPMTDFEQTLPPAPPPIEVEEPLKGLKIHIGGKGSGTKGLTGICCFEMLQASNCMLLRD